MAGQLAPTRSLVLSIGSGVELDVVVPWAGPAPINQSLSGTRVTVEKRTLQAMFRVFRSDGAVVLSHAFTITDNMAGGPLVVTRLSIPASEIDPVVAQVSSGEYQWDVVACGSEVLACGDVIGANHPARHGWAVPQPCYNCGGK